MTCAVVRVIPTRAGLLHAQIYLAEFPPKATFGQKTAGLHRRARESRFRVKNWQVCIRYPKPEEHFEHMIPLEACKIPGEE
ncbi:MAG: hypothetical protein PUG40_01885 [Berryella intestinalis]|nr:hypothetical protein [Berryella intestinalis]